MAKPEQTKATVLTIELGEPNPTSSTLKEERLMTCRQIREMFGDVSQATVFRWGKNPALGFPAPVQIHRRNYWRASEIRAWREKQIGKPTA
jgi:predicted DNA-binding transcriptional regulator AlpA